MTTTASHVSRCFRFAQPRRAAGHRSSENQLSGPGVQDVFSIMSRESIAFETMPAFSTPILLVDVPDAAAMNAELAYALLAREKEGVQNVFAEAKARTVRNGVSATSRPGTRHAEGRQQCAKRSCCCWLGLPWP